MWSREQKMFRDGDKKRVKSACNKAEPSRLKPRMGIVAIYEREHRENIERYQRRNILDVRTYTVNRCIRS